jgi:hypothetical protein
MFLVNWPQSCKGARGHIAHSLFLGLENDASQLPEGPPGPRQMTVIGLGLFESRRFRTQLYALACPLHAPPID